MIAGDNANIYRLVGIGGEDGNGFLEFDYDQSSAYEDRGDLRIIPRAVELLDYTPGGASFDCGRRRRLSVRQTRSTARPATTSSTA